MGLEAPGPFLIPVIACWRRVRDILTEEMNGLVSTVCSRSSSVISTGWKQVGLPCSCAPKNDLPSVGQFGILAEGKRRQTG